MKNAMIAILLCGAAVVWFQSREDDRIKIKSDIETSWISNDRGDDKVSLKADTQTGQVEVQLPGGIGGKVRLPEGLSEDTKFDLDGIGRYPGARLLNVDLSGGGSSEGRLALGFSAPGSADTVADWYQKALIAKGRTVARTGNTITGATEDGEPMVIAVEDGPGDMARGRIIISGLGDEGRKAR